MLRRKKFHILQQQQDNDKLVFLLGARQVGKTTLMKQLYNSLQTDKKLYINLENRRYHRYFDTVESILAYVQSVGGTPGESFTLFLDEFHVVEGIDWKLKTVYDDHRWIKVYASGSNNIVINEKIRESFAGRKVIIPIYPLDFDEFLIWKNNLEGEEALHVWKQRLDTQDMQDEALLEYMTYGSYPEVVQTPLQQKRDVLASIFDARFQKDIMHALRKEQAFLTFAELLPFFHATQMVYEKLAQQVGVSIPTIQSYLHLMEETFLMYRIKPFYKHSRKEVSKQPKFYFMDSGMRNWLIRRNTFSDTEKGELFEGVVMSEYIKRGEDRQMMKYRRDNNKREVDLILDHQKTAYEIKRISAERTKAMYVFRDLYPAYHLDLINKQNRGTYTKI